MMMSLALMKRSQVGEQDLLVVTVGLEQDHSRGGRHASDAGLVVLLVLQWKYYSTAAMTTNAKKLVCHNLAAIKPSDQDSYKVEHLFILVESSSCFLENIYNVWIGIDLCK